MARPARLGHQDKIAVYQEHFYLEDRILPVVLWDESDEGPGVVDECAAAGAQPGQEEDELLPPAKLTDLLEDQVVTHRLLPLKPYRIITAPSGETVTPAFL